MTGIARILRRRYRRRWAAALGVIAVLALAAIVCLVLVKSGTLDAAPWLYLALAVALLAGVGGIVVTLLEAKFQENTTSKSTRKEAARQIHKRHSDHPHLP